MLSVFLSTNCITMFVSDASFSFSKKNYDHKVFPCNIVVARYVFCGEDISSDVRSVGCPGGSVRLIDKLMLHSEKMLT